MLSSYMNFIHCMVKLYLIKYTTNKKNTNGIFDKTTTLAFYIYITIKRDILCRE